MMIKTNYHTHHYLCGHSVGKAEDYIIEAIKKGYKEIGISDHSPLPIEPPFPRMSYNDFINIYLKDIDTTIEKYNSKIKIYKSLEVEYVYGHNEFYKDLLSKTDYLILALHYYSGYENMKSKSAYEVNSLDKLKEYCRLAIDAMNTGFFKIFAHPDIFMGGYPILDSSSEECINELIQAAIKNDVYLEFNAGGVRKGKVKLVDNEYEYLFPNDQFWQLVSKTDVKVIVNSDCHSPQELEDEAMLEAKKLANTKYKLNIINHI